MKQYNMLKDDVKSLFFRYLVPAICGTLVTSIYILVDTIVIGKGIGTQAVAGLNILLPLFAIFYGTGLLFGVGGSVLMSFSKGKGDEKKGRGYFSTAILCVLIMALLYTVCMSLFFEPITNFLGTTSATREYVDGYGKTVVWGSTTFILSSFLQTFIRNDKAPKLAMAGTIAGGMLNIVLDLVFVYVFKWGMFGAAIATVIGNGLSIVVYSTHFFTKHNSLKFSLKSITLKMPLQIIKTGTSSFILELSAGIVTFLFNIQLLKYIGVTGVTAYSIISNTAIMIISMSNGVSQAAQPIVATNYGAGQMQRVAAVRRLGLMISAGMGAIFTAVALAAPSVLLNIFIRPTAEVTAIALPAIRIYAIAFMLAAVNLFLCNYFQGILKPSYSMIICLSRGLVFNVLFVFLLPLVMGVNGIWLTVPLAETITICITFFLLHRAGKKGSSLR